MTYVEKKLKQGGADKQSKLIEIGLKVCHCCLACFERIIKFINKNAYINTAVASNNFCVACRESFFLILRNGFLYAIAAGIGEIFIWFGRLFITVTSVVIGW